MRTIRYIVEPQEDGRRVGSYLRGGWHLQPPAGGLENRLRHPLQWGPCVIDRVHAGDELCITIDDHPKEYLATPSRCQSSLRTRTFGLQ